MVPSKGCPPPWLADSTALVPSEHTSPWTPGPSVPSQDSPSLLFPPPEVPWLTTRRHHEHTHACLRPRWLGPQRPARLSCLLSFHSSQAWEAEDALPSTGLPDLAQDKNIGCPGKSGLQVNRSYFLCPTRYTGHACTKRVSLSEIQI